jgi:hypothetical protein
MTAADRRRFDDGKKVKRSTFIIRSSLEESVALRENASLFA